MITKGKMNTGLWNLYSLNLHSKIRGYWDIEIRISVPKSIKVVLATINEVKTSKPFKLRALLEWLIHASR